MADRTNFLTIKKKKRKRSRPSSDLAHRLLRPVVIFTLLMNLKTKFTPQSENEASYSAHVNRTDISACLSHMFSNSGFLTKTKLKFVDIPTIHPSKAVILLTVVRGH